MYYLTRWTNTKWLHDHMWFKPKGILPVLAQKEKRPPGWAVAILGWLEVPQKLGDTHVHWWAHEHNLSLAGKRHKKEKRNLTFKRALLLIRGLGNQTKSISRFLRNRIKEKYPWNKKIRKYFWSGFSWFWTSVRSRDREPQQSDSSQCKIDRLANSSFILLPGKTVTN